jgi:quercetin dioxygenase-like cupin family protein
MSAKRLMSALLAAGTLFTIQPVFAHDGSAGEEKVVPLLQKALPDAVGKKAIMLTVNYSAGQASQAHVHPGSVFAYVLEGAVISQIEGQAPTEYKVGDYWYEPPGTPHLVSRNASKTAPAKLLVWLLMGEGEQPKLPLKK